MLSETLTQGLRDYAIGEKVRTLRLRRKMGLVELGKHSGLSAALLSKIETSRIFPPLPTLLRIAMVFGVGLDHFFTDETRKHPVSVVRKSDRQRFPNKPHGEDVAYFFESLDFTANDRKLNAYFAEFQSITPDQAEPHTHAGVEFIYVLGGRLAMAIGRAEVDLSEGDSIYFDSVVPHSYRRASFDRCTALVVTTGP